MSEASISVKVVSSAAAFRQFIESTVWRDIEACLLDYLAGLKEELLTLVDKDLYRCQGNAIAIKYMLGLPHKILADLEFEAAMSLKESQNGDRRNGTQG